MYICNLEVKQEWHFQVIVQIYKPRFRRREPWISFSSSSIKMSATAQAILVRAFSLKYLDLFLMPVYWFLLMKSINFGCNICVKPNRRQAEYRHNIKMLFYQHEDSHYELKTVSRSSIFIMEILPLCWTRSPVLLYILKLYKRIDTSFVVFCRNLILFDCIDIFRGYFIGTGAIWLPQCRWNNTEEHG